MHAADQFEAVENINDLVKNIPTSKEYKEFRQFANMIKNWMPEILNYFKYGKQYTNATTEGVNALIKQLNGVGRGYSFEILRAKSLYWSEAHRSPVTKSRLKPGPMTYTDPRTMDWANPWKMGGSYEKVTVSGDMSDISILLDRFNEVF